VIFWIDTKNPLLDVGQAVGRIDFTRFSIQPNTRTRNQVTINTVFDRLKLRVRPAKPLTVPKVNARLILDINVNVISRDIAAALG
jgi:hypothetical protein